ncbi:MAG: hypothetical protein KGK01_04900 [Bradyrhizobium sp.]|uniref:hypothetical protein n=1 Tax=Bradyrhizobium sp. TaxID=376 RepID=UPI00239EDF51|nr:hypothetical protein [Bradyrhizobium sp.]MDE2241793.1 hypothetical protein [Bradyrhizobium sp.]MDE2471542.1 hypothetical protein [Bradyrhizobium sp.]
MIETDIRQRPALPGFFLAQSNCLIARRDPHIMLVFRVFTWCNSAASETVAYAHAGIPAVVPNR